MVLSRDKYISPIAIPPGKTISDEIKARGRKQIDAKKLINALYRDPIMDGAQIAEALEVHSSTANRLIKDFEALGILREFTGYKRNRIYIFEPYVKLF